jgi:hypothetical protein
MFEPANLACPNCGASSITNGVCDFCGAKVFVSDDGIIPVPQEETGDSVIVRKYKPFDDAYITQVRTCYRKRKCMYFTDSKKKSKELRLEFIETKKSQTLRFDFSGESRMIIDTGNTQFRIDESSKLNRTKLDAMCKAKQIKVMFTGSQIIDTNKIILLAQAFYNHIFDESAFVDAEGKLCQLFNSKDPINKQYKNPGSKKTQENKEQKKPEKEQKEDWEKKYEGDNFQSCLIVLLIVGGLAILSIVAGHIFKPVGW